tara:strand:- start:10718 stop:11584 length:867 start_codon:yes stop_codon:yes gene_type:complete
MKKKLSEKIEGSGIKYSFNINLLKPNNEREKIIKLFRKYGIICFTKCNISPLEFFKFTKLFTHEYSIDAARREVRFNNKNIRNVDSGFHEIPLHSESSFTSTWPKIIWFYCKKISKKSACTTICDGVKLWNELSLNTKKFFQKEQIIFHNKIDIGFNKKNKKKTDWYISSPGAFNAKINWKSGYLEYKLKRSAVNENYSSKHLSFCNHILSIDDEKQIINYQLENKKKIPKKIMIEIINKSKKLTYLHQWKEKEFLMIDNKRFLHGRKAINKNDVRDIINIQTLNTNF